MAFVDGYYVPLSAIRGPAAGSGESKAAERTLLAEGNQRSDVQTRAIGRAQGVSNALSEGEDVEDNEDEQQRENAATDTSIEDAMRRTVGDGFANDGGDGRRWSADASSLRSRQTQQPGRSVDFSLFDRRGGRQAPGGRIRLGSIDERRVSVHREEIEGALAAANLNRPPGGEPTGESGDETSGQSARLDAHGASSDSEANGAEARRPRTETEGAIYRSNIRKRNFTTMTAATANDFEGDDGDDGLIEDVTAEELETIRSETWKPKLAKKVTLSRPGYRPAWNWGKRGCFGVLKIRPSMAHKHRVFVVMDGTDCDNFVTIYANGDKPVQEALHVFPADCFWEATWGNSEVHFSHKILCTNNHFVSAMAVCLEQMDVLSRIRDIQKRRQMQRARRRRGSLSRVPTSQIEELPAIQNVTAQSTFEQPIRHAFAAFRSLGGGVGESSGRSAENRGGSQLPFHPRPKRGGNRMEESYAEESVSFKPSPADGANQPRRKKREAVKNVVRKVTAYRRKASESADGFHIQGDIHPPDRSGSTVEAADGDHGGVQAVDDEAPNLTRMSSSSSSSSSSASSLGPRRSNRRVYARSLTPGSRRHRSKKRKRTRPAKVKKSAGAATERRATRLHEIPVDFGTASSPSKSAASQSLSYFPSGEAFVAGEGVVSVKDGNPSSAMMLALSPRDAASRSVDQPEALPESQISEHQSLEMYEEVERPRRSQATDRQLVRSSTDCIAETLDELHTFVANLNPSTLDLYIEHDPRPATAQRNVGNSQSDSAKSPPSTAARELEVSDNKPQVTSMTFHNRRLHHDPRGAEVNFSASSPDPDTVVAANERLAFGATASEISLPDYGNGGAVRVSALLTSCLTQPATSPNSDPSARQQSNRPVGERVYPSISSTVGCLGQKMQECRASATREEGSNPSFRLTSIAALRGPPSSEKGQTGTTLTSTSSELSPYDNPSVRGSATSHSLAAVDSSDHFVKRAGRGSKTRLRDITPRRWASPKEIRSLASGQLEAAVSIPGQHEKLSRIGDSSNSVEEERPMFAMSRQEAESLGQGHAVDLQLNRLPRKQRSSAPQDHQRAEFMVQGPDAYSADMRTASSSSPNSDLDDDEARFLRYDNLASESVSMDDSGIALPRQARLRPAISSNERRLRQRPNAPPRPADLAERQTAVQKSVRQPPVSTRKRRGPRQAEDAPSQRREYRAVPATTLRDNDDDDEDSLRQDKVGAMSQPLIAVPKLPLGDIPRKHQPPPPPASGGQLTAISHSRETSPALSAVSGEVDAGPRKLSGSAKTVSEVKHLSTAQPPAVSYSGSGSANREEQKGGSLLKKLSSLARKPQVAPMDTPSGGTVYRGTVATSSGGGAQKAPGGGGLAARFAKIKSAERP